MGIYRLYHLRLLGPGRYFKGHGTAATAVQAAVMAFKSGVNLNCGNIFDPNLIQAVKQGLISENQIDSSLRISLKHV